MDGLEIILFPMIILSPFIINALIFFLVIKSKKKKIAQFEKEHPSYVKIKILSKSAFDYFIINIYEVNGQAPVFSCNKEFLYLPVGNNQIIADYIEFDKARKDKYIAGPLLGGIVGLIIYLSAIKKKGKKEELKEKAIKINLLTKPRYSYELKANFSEKAFKLTCFEGEKHEILTFK